LPKAYKRKATDFKQYGLIISKQVDVLNVDPLVYFMYRLHKYM